MTNTTSKDNSARDIDVPTKDDELRNKIVDILYRYPGMNFLADTSKDIVQLIKQREEQVTREARIDELNYVKDKLTRWGMDTIDPKDIAARITQLATPHKGDQ